MSATSAIFTAAQSGDEAEAREALVDSVLASVLGVMTGESVEVQARRIDLGDHELCCDRSGGLCHTHRRIAGKLRVIARAFGAVEI